MLSLDELLVIPAAIPPHKQLLGDAGTDQRLEMTRLAFSDISGITVSDMEIKRGGKSYTVDTLRALKDDNTDLYLLMGTAAGIIWSERTTFSWVLTGMFFFQLGLNVLWSFCFFYLQSPIFGFAALIILILFLLVYVSGCYMQKPLAAYLNIPYLAWLLFAAYLNGYVMFNN
jgi:hypothetical protein